MVCRAVLVGCAVLAAGCGRSGEQKTSQAAPPRDAGAPADAASDAAEPAARPIDLAKATLVIARGDLHAIDGEMLRPVTETAGQVIAALRGGAEQLAFVTHGARGLAIGTIDLATGATTSPIELGAAAPITIAYSAKAPSGFWIASGAPKRAWRRLADGTLAKLPRSTKTPGGPRLEIAATGARLVVAPTTLVTADWDDVGLASAIRIKTSNRVVTAPSPGLIDGGSIVWSPGKSHLAFVAQLDDICTPGAPTVAAYAADAATGQLTELARAARGLAVVWTGERVLAVAGDDGVTSIELGGGPPRALAGASDLVIPRRRPPCVDQPPADQPAPEITPASRVDETPDAAVVEPPPGVSSSPPQIR